MKMSDIKILHFSEVIIVQPNETSTCSFKPTPHAVKAAAL